jgi:hypothetical protein
MSNGTSFSLVKHCTQGNFAKVAIPEKIASAVTRIHRKAFLGSEGVVKALTRIISRIRRLIRKADISQRQLILVMTLMAYARRPEGQHEQAEQRKL